MPGANPVTFEPEGTHDTHAGGAKGRRRVETIDRHLRCAIAIHNAQSVSRTETETLLGN